MIYVHNSFSHPSISAPNFRNYSPVWKFERLGKDYGELTRSDTLCIIWLYDGWKRFNYAGALEVLYNHYWERLPINLKSLSLQIWFCCGFITDYWAIPLILIMSV